MSGKLGSLDAIKYFVKRSSTPRDTHPIDYIILAPTSTEPAPSGYSTEYADSLSSVDRLQAILLNQERREWERESIVDEMTMGQRQRAIVDSMRTRMVSSSTSPYERDFIAAYLQLSEGRKDKHRQRFHERTAYLSVLARETPKGRRANEESVNLDRLELSK